MSAKCTLEDQVKKLEEDCGSLQASKATLEEECKTLRQKVEILNELYQQKEMALQKKLSQEEFERQDREQRLSAADEKVLLAAEEVKTYKRRIEEMEDELQKTERSFKNQIATHEKKATTTGSKLELQKERWLKSEGSCQPETQIIGTNPKDGNAAGRTCDCETNAGKTQHPEPSSERSLSQNGSSAHLP